MTATSSTALEALFAGATNFKFYATRDRSEWGPHGAWNSEPADKIQWIDPATGLDCLMHRNYSGAWCGYVGISAEHPLYGKSYDDCDAEVHGGLTFACACADTTDESHGICHIAAPGRPSTVWWLGFDCSHLGDERPRKTAYDSSFGEVEHYRAIPYVKREVESLAQQLKEHA